MSKPEDKAPAGPSNGDRLAPPQANGAGKTPFGVLGIPEPVIHLRRTWGVWQVPELDIPHAEALLELWSPGNFLVIGHDPSQVLVLKTGPASGEVGTYQIKKLPGGVSLESSNICMPDLLHLLAFLSASRDVLPRTLLLPPPTYTVPLQSGGVQVTTEGRVLSLVNKVYLETHGAWDPPEQTTPELLPQTAGKQEPGELGLAQGLRAEVSVASVGSDVPSRPAPRNASPHRVSWVEGPLSPEGDYHGPTLTSLIEEKDKEEEEEEEEENEQEQKKEKEDEYKEEEGAEDELTRHIRALVRARNSYVARQFRSFRARLTSDSGGPHRPGDPATELLQDVRHLLTDLQDYLAEDPDVTTLSGSRGPGIPQKDMHLGSSLEAALCRAVLTPLQPLLWKRLRTLRAPELRRLRRRQIALRAGAGPLGAQGAGPDGQGPAPAVRSRIHARLAQLHATCAPRRKVALLLAVCSDVYAGLAAGENHEPLGADAFLPALTEELIWSPDLGETQLDVEFLMELLDPDELLGETGYYLTTWFGALHHIAHYEPEVVDRAPQELSNEARASLRQWHRRRTLHGPTREGAQTDLSFEEPWAVQTV